MTFVAKGNGVPVPPAPFVGRLDELAWLRDAVAPGAWTAVAAAGVTGVGRTALVQAFAREADFDTVLWWSTQLDGSRPHLALRRWAMRCGLPVDGLGTVEGLLQAVAMGLPDAGSLLVVIDDVDDHHLDVVQDVLSALPADAAVLLTTTTVRVAEALSARTLVLGPLNDEDGRAMLEAITDGRMPPMVVQTVLETADRLPLALRVFAHRLRASDPDEATGIWGLPPSPSAVARLGGQIPLARATLMALERADDDTARVFRALGLLHHGPVQPARVAALLDMSEASAFDHLHRLVDLGLLVGAGGAGRWQMHAAHVDHARRLLEAAGEAHDLYLERVAEVVESEGSPSSGFGPLDLLDTLELARIHGQVDHLIALAEHAAPAIGAWCHEAARELVGAAAQAAQAAGRPESAALRAQADQLDTVAAVISDALEVSPLDDDAVQGSDDWVDIVELSGGVGAEAQAARVAVDEVLAFVEPIDDLGQGAHGVESTIEVEVIGEEPLPDPGADDGLDLEELDGDDASLDDISSLLLHDTIDTVDTDDDAEQDYVATQAISTAAIEAAMAAARARPRPQPAPPPHKPSAAPPEAAAEPVRPADPAQDFLVAHGLSLVLTEADAEPGSDAPEADGPTQIFDIGRMMAFVRGAQSEQARTAALDRAQVAEASAMALHARTVELVRSAVDAAPTTDAWRDARARLLGAARKVGEHVRAARAGAQAAVESGEAASARRAADRAERAHEAASRAMAVVERAWTDCEDARVEVVESAARAEAALHRARSNAALARQGVEETERRVQAGKDTAGPSVAEAFEDVDAAMASARDAADQAAAVWAQVEARTLDPELGAAEIGKLREVAEASGAEALERLSRSARNARAELKRHAMLEEAREQAERVDGDAAWIVHLTDEIDTLLQDREDAEARDLRARVRELRGNVERHRVRAAEAVQELQIAAERAWREQLEHIAAAGRATMDGLQEAERLRADVDAWAALEVETSEDVALAGLQAEAATAVATIEATAAVAWRAASRAHQAAAHHVGGLADAVAVLKEGELRLRSSADAARAALRKVIEAEGLSNAHALWNHAGPLVEEADDAAADTRAMAEALLEAADARRRTQVEACVTQGEATAARIESMMRVARMAAVEVRSLAEDFPDEPVAPLARLEDTEVRLAVTDAAVQDGLQRLRRARDGELAERLVTAISEAAELASVQLREVEQVQLEMRSLHEMRFDPGFRRQQAEDVLDEARAAIAAAEAEVAKVRADAGAAHDVVGAALGESVQDLVQARALLDDSPVLGEDPTTWDADYEEITARADAVTRLTERVRLATLSARSLLSMVAQRRHDDVVEAKARQAAPLDEAVAEARAAVSMLEEPPEVDDAWPVPIGRIHLGWQQAVDAVHGALVTLETLAARMDGHATVPDLGGRVTRLRAQVEAEADRARRRAEDLRASVATWQEHVVGRSAAAAEVSSSLDDAAFADEAATLVDPGVTLQPALVAGDDDLVDAIDDVLDPTAIVPSGTPSPALRAQLQDAALRAALSADEVAGLARDAAVAVGEADVGELALVAELDALALSARALADEAEQALQGLDSGVATGPVELLARAEVCCDTAEAALWDARELREQVTEAVAAMRLDQLEQHRRGAQACLVETEVAVALLRDRHAAAASELVGAGSDPELQVHVDALAGLLASAELGLGRIRDALPGLAADDHRAVAAIAGSIAVGTAEVLALGERASQHLDGVRDGARAVLDRRLQQGRGGAEAAAELGQAGRALADAAIAAGRRARAEHGDLVQDAAARVEAAGHALADLADVVTTHAETAARSGSATQALAAAEQAEAAAAGLAPAQAAAEAARAELDALVVQVAATLAAEQQAARARRGDVLTQVEAALAYVTTARETAQGLAAAHGQAIDVLVQLDGVVQTLADWRRAVHAADTAPGDPRLVQAVVDADAALAVAWDVHGRVVDAVRASTRSAVVTCARDHALVAAQEGEALEEAIAVAGDALQVVEAEAERVRTTPPPVLLAASPRVAMSLRRAGQPLLALEAAQTAQTDGADLPDDARAVLALGVAQAWLGLGYAAAARAAVDEATALTEDAEIVALAARVLSLTDRLGGAPTGPAAAWVASKDVRRRARRLGAPA